LAFKIEYLFNAKIIEKTKHNHSLLIFYGKYLLFRLSGVQK